MGKAGKALRRVLKTHSISQYHLATKMGIDRSNISRWVSEHRDPAAEAVFQIRQALEAIESAIGAFTIFLGSIAAISLLVGGIGIMNIMFVTVTERTREIGIRKAMGAKRRDIMLQFVTEAAVLSFGGGLVGLVLGGLITMAMNGQDFLGGPTLETSLDIQITILALGVSIGIGLFFGIYPALRAARLHPIDALRYE